MAPIVRPPDVFLWSWTSSMPFLRFLSGFGEKNGRKVVLEPPDLRTNCMCNRRVTVTVSRQRARPPTYLPQRACRVSNPKLHVAGAPGRPAAADRRRRALRACLSVHVRASVTRVCPGVSFQETPRATGRSHETQTHTS